MKNALVNHKERLDGVKELLSSFSPSLRKRKSLTFSEKERRIASPIYSTASILPIAYFEIFIETIILRLIDCINENSSSIEWTKLPPKIRKAHLENAILKLKEIERNESYDAKETSERIKNIIKYATQPYIIAEYKCELEELLNSKSNYYASRINSIFNSIGLNDIFLIISKKNILKSLTRELIRDKLTELCNRRDMAAHGVDIINTGVTIQNMEEGIDFIYNLSESFVVVLDDYLVSIEDGM